MGCCGPTRVQGASLSQVGSLTATLATTGSDVDSLAEAAGEKEDGQGGSYAAPPRSVITLAGRLHNTGIMMIDGTMSCQPECECARQKYVRILKLKSSCELHGQSDSVRWPVAHLASFYAGNQPVATFIAS